MPTTRMVLKLTNHDVATEEGVTLVDDGSWSSPPGGWLSVQSGSWDQSPIGVHLNRTGNQGGNVAQLKGLTFATSKVNDTGSALYPDIAKTGNWEVVATTP